MGLYKFENKIVLDFSTNLNPLGMPKAVERAVIGSVQAMSEYPDRNCTLLRHKLSVFENVPMENIACGSGADDLIFRAISAIKPKNVLLFLPCPWEYKRALELHGCNVIEVCIPPEDNFRLKTSAADHITSRIDMVLISSPNNPAGVAATPCVMQSIVEKCRNTGTFIMCDERYIEFMYKSGDYSAKRFMFERMIVVKSFVKIFSMAGMRVGYALTGDPVFAEKLRNTGQLHTVSGIALAAAETAVQELDFMQMSRKYVECSRRGLSGELTRLGLHVFPSNANFLLIRCDLPLDKLLMLRGIKIRNCKDHYGLGDGYFRISVRSPKENARLIDALKKILLIYLK